MANLKETRELLTFVFSLVEGVKAAGADGKVTVTDVPGFFNALINAPSGIGGADLIITEIVEATEDERIELNMWIAEKFDISNEKAEMFIEGVFIHVVGIIRQAAIAFRSTPAVD